MAKVGPIKHAYLHAETKALHQKKRNHITFGLLCSLLLVYLLFSYSKTTNSLLLFNLGLIQLGISGFFLQTWLQALFRTLGIHRSVRWWFTMLISFGLVLSSGYTFIEIYSRLSVPVAIHTQQALLTGGLLLGGNYLLFKILQSARIQRLRFGILHLRFPHLLKIQALSLFFLLLIHLTHLNRLDTWFSLLTGLPLLILAGFIMIDAYWKMEEENRGAPL